MKIFNEIPKIKTIKTVHFFDKNKVSFSLSDTLTKNNSGFKTPEPYLQVRAMPENVKINSGQKNDDSGAYWSHSISLEVNDQNNILSSMLNSYANKKIVCCVETTNDTVYIYGNVDQPLTFRYKDLEGTTLAQTIGYEISISGDTYSSCEIISIYDFYQMVVLASWLPITL